MSVAPSSRRRPPQAVVELVEVGPGIAVVGAEAGQVDVGQKEHVVDDQTGMASGMSWQVQRLDGYAAAEIEDVPLFEPFGIGPCLV